MPILVHKRITRWGNGYGIRLTKADIERLRVREGDEIDAELYGAEDRVMEEELDRLAIFRFGGYENEDLDDLIGKDVLEELERTAREDDDGDR